jgi:exopolysaccharide biosynthesis polyprenyl glycosylphosphotransferase
MPRTPFRLTRLLRHGITRANHFFDGACALVVMLLTFTFLNSGRMPKGLEEFLSVRLSVKNIALVVAFVAVWHLCFSIFGLYRAWQGEAPPRPILDTALRVAGACTLGTIVLSLFTFASQTGAFNLEVVVLFGVACIMAELAGRGLIALAGRSIERHAREVRQAVIVGSGPRALALAQNIEDRAVRECDVAGFVDTRPIDDVEEPLCGRMIGTLEDLESLLCTTPIDLVLIALPIKSCYVAIQQVLDTCERIGVEATYFPDVFSTALTRPAYDDDGERLAVHYQTVVDDYRVLVKRGMDILLSAIGLVVLSPVLLGCAIAVKWTSPGPVLFSQFRYGHNRRQFRMFKFRTMVVDAERLQASLEAQNEASGPVFKIRKDPRLTRCGALMRKLSLDELPQLFNVLRGDMSLVGPRPLPPRDVLRFSDAWLMRRFSVKPGLTCLWQINGRSETAFDEWVRLDLDYIDNWSLALDMRILVKTVPTVISGSGAM